VDIGCAEAFLRRGESQRGGSFTSQKERDHLLHTRGCQQDCRVIAWYERRTGHNHMTFAGKEIQEKLANLSTCQFQIYRHVVLLIYFVGWPLWVPDGAWGKVNPGQGDNARL